MENTNSAQRQFYPKSAKNSYRREIESPERVLTHSAVFCASSLTPTMEREVKLTLLTQGACGKLVEYFAAKGCSAEVLHQHN